MPTCWVTSAGSPGRWPGLVSARATGCSSICRWCPRPRSPCWPAPGSGRSTRWCSAGSRRPRSRPASTMPSPSSSSPPPAASSPAGWCPISRSSPRASPAPSTSRTRLCSCNGSKRRPRCSTAGWTGKSSSARRPVTPVPTVSRLPRPTRSISSTPPGRPGSPRASTATTAATRLRCAGRCATSTTSSRARRCSRPATSAGSSGTPTSSMPPCSLARRRSFTKASRSGPRTRARSGGSSPNTAP